MTNAVFITGTDTDIGKTFVSCLLLQEFNALGLKTFAIKPIASGSQRDNDGKLRNQDALRLQRYSSIKKPYHVVNPIVFEKPVSPHIAAHEEGIQFSKSFIINKLISSIQSDADINVIEGVGGWAVPLNDNELLSDVFIELKIPVILVVGIKLGCLNHALLTYQNILTKNVPLIGWIANCLDVEMLSEKENILTLQNWIKSPCLGVIPHNCQSLGYIDVQRIQLLTTRHPLRLNVLRKL